MPDWHQGDTIVIGPRQAGDFAAAVGETDPALLAGHRVVPTMAILPAWECEDRPVADVIGARAAAATLHAEHGFEFLAPLRAGLPLSARSRLIDVAVRRNGTFITVATEISDPAGLVNRQRYVVFAPGVLPETEQSVSSAEQTASADDQNAVVSAGSAEQTVDQRWADRYARASGDHFEVHLNDEYARSLGFPGTILHGMCTMAIAARAVGELAGIPSSDDLVRLGVRFAAPVVLPARLRTDVAIGQRSDGIATGRFSMHDVDRGSAVLTRGTFAVRRR